MALLATALSAPAIADARSRTMDRFVFGKDSRTRPYPRGLGRTGNTAKPYQVMTDAPTFDKPIPLAE